MKDTVERIVLKILGKINEVGDQIDEGYFEDVDPEDYRAVKEMLLYSVLESYLTYCDKVLEDEAYSEIKRDLIKNIKGYIERFDENKVE